MKCSCLLFITVAFLLSVGHATTQYVAYSSHTDSACTSVPTQLAYLPQGSNNCNATSCAIDTTTGLYLLTSCVTNPSARSMTLFGKKPWLQFDIYEPNTQCAMLTSGITYLADGTCLSVDNAASSLRAFVFANKSAVIARYNGASCRSSPTKTNTIGATKLAKSSCINGILLASSGNATLESSTGTNDAIKATPSAIATLLVAVTTILTLW